MWSIIKLGLEKGIEAFDRSEWFLSTNGNWNCVTNAGMIVGSLAIYHDDPTGTSQKLLPQSIQNARNYCVRGVYDDGTWSETPDYWQVYFGTQSHAELSSALLTATGTSLANNDALNSWYKTGEFHMYNFGPVGKFDYGDCGPNKITATANSLLFDGNQLQNPIYTLYQRDKSDAADPLSMFWYDTKANGSWSDNLPLDKAFSDPRGAWVSMRSSWTNSDALFVAMKAGQLSGHQTHGNLDAGDFVFQAMGEKWAIELCHENYDAPNYFSSEKMDSQRWQYYRCGSIGQNTLLFNQSNQLVQASPSVEFQLRDDDMISFWIADLTSAYEGVSSIRRGLRLFNERTSALIQDEIVGATKSSQWRMHTTATITLSEDRKKAVLRLKHKSISIILQSPTTLLFEMASPVRSKEDPLVPDGISSPLDQNISVLSVNVPEGNQTIAIIFQPQWNSPQDFTKLPQLAPLDSWSLLPH